MASSKRTYDAFLRHAPSDGLSALRVARTLRLGGLRVWFDKWSDLPGARFDDRVHLAQSASRVVVTVVGPAGFPYWTRENPWAGVRLDHVATVNVLAPGFRHSPTDLPSCLADFQLVDMRRALDAASLDRLIPAIDSSSDHGAAGDSLGARLAPEVLRHNCIRSYDRIAEKFAFRWFRHPPLSTLEKLLRRLPRKATVLDAGCGPGHHAKLIADNGHDVVGVDLSEGMLRNARKRVRSVRFEKMDVQSLRFPPRTFDAVWCAAVALHIPREEIVELLRGFRLVLKTGGILGISLQVGRRSEVVEYGSDHRFFEYYRDDSEIERLLRLAGFSVVDRDYGETTRNTHDLDVTLKWATLYARPRDQEAACRSLERS